MGLRYGSDWHNVAQSPSQNFGPWARVAVRLALILALGLVSCVGGPHPEPPLAATESPTRPVSPAGTGTMMGQGGMSPAAPVVPAPSAPGAAPAVPSTAVGGAGAPGAGGAAPPVSENAACPPLDGGLPDAGMLDAGADAAMPDCDDDAGM
jgi:hypothetical protein